MRVVIGEDQALLREGVSVTDKASQLPGYLSDTFLHLDFGYAPKFHKPRGQVLLDTMPVDVALPCATQNELTGRDDGFVLVQHVDALHLTLSEAHLGLLLDIVPNHMGIGTGQNARWRDVQSDQYLASGPPITVSVL